MSNQGIFLHLLVFFHVSKDCSLDVKYHKFTSNDFVKIKFYITYQTEANKIVIQARPAHTGCRQYTI